MNRAIGWFKFASSVFLLVISSSLASAQNTSGAPKAGTVLVFENYQFDANKPPTPTGEIVEYRIEAVNTDSLTVAVPSIKALNFGKPVVFDANKSVFSFTSDSQWLIKNKATDGVDQFLNPRLKVGDKWKGPHPNNGSKLDWVVEAEQSFKLGSDTLKALQIVGSGRWFGGGYSGKLRIEYLYSPEKQLLLGIHDDYMDGSGFGSTRGMKIVLKDIRSE